MIESTTIKYKCPECGLAEPTERERPKCSTYPVIRLCWFCLIKGKHVEMEKTSDRRDPKGCI